MRAIPTILRRSATSSLRTTVRLGSSAESRLSRMTCTRRLSSARPIPAEQDVCLLRSQNVSKAIKTATVPSGAQATSATDETNGSKTTNALPSIATTTDPFDQLNPFETISPTTLTYTGDAVIPITSKLNIIRPQDDTPRGIWPVFRLMVRCQVYIGAEKEVSRRKLILFLF
jgi:hypothetical protein